MPPKEKEKDPVADRQKTIDDLNAKIAAERDGRLARQVDSTREIEVSALDSEIARLEAVLSEEQAITVRSGAGGTVDAARAAMELAQQESAAQQQALEAERKGS